MTGIGSRGVMNPVHQKGWFAAAIRFVLGLPIGAIVGLALCGPSNENLGPPEQMPFLWETVAVAAMVGGVLSAALGDRFWMWFAERRD